MYFSGFSNNFRQTPEVPRARVLLKDISILGGGTGICELGISGQNNKLSFTFSGQKILSPLKKVIGSFSSGVPFNLDWNIETGYHQYGLDESIIENKVSKNNFNIQRFYINCTGLPISLSGALFSESIPNILTFPNQFQALSPLQGNLVNLSSYNFRIFNSNLNFYNGPEQVLTGNPTGIVSGNNSLLLSLSDENTSLLDSEILFGIDIDSSVGKIQQVFDVNRVSGLEIVTGNLESSIDDTQLVSLFDGSGIIGNQFIYTNNPSSLLITYFCPYINLKGEEKTKTINFQLTGISPSNNSVAASSYVTGFQISSSGEYLIPPTAKFTGYYYVSGIDRQLNSILLSSGCSGNVPVIFSGNGSRGVGGSGIFLSKKVLMSGIYGEGLNTYYLPQSMQIISGGTGYISQPMAFLNTGIFSNCYDVGTKYNTNYLIFSPFKGNGTLGSLADYLTGEVLTTTGLVSGGQLTGYLVTGIRFTNIGSGYDSVNNIPLMSFYRDSSDILTGNSKNASGILQMKSTGLYSINQNWFLNTGVSSTNLSGFNNYSGSTILDSGSNYFTIQVNLSGNDFTQPLAIQLTTSLGNKTVSHLLTGTRSYDISTGFLKKKNNLNLITFNENQNLSFSLTQSDLDTYYSDDNFINNFSDGFPSLGDLDF